MIKFNLFFVLLFLLLSCGNDDNGNPDVPQETVIPPAAMGIVYYESSVALQQAYTNLKNALQNNESIAIVQELDHAQNAASVNMELEPTKIIFFGNPQLGTPLMQEDQLAGLDLPQRILFYEERNELFVLYNSSEYFSARYGAGEVETLPQISEALNGLVSTATNAEAIEIDVQDVGLHEGILNVRSNFDFETTYENLRSSIEANENLTIVAELDHRENAASVGMELKPTSVIMFGNPNLGTPLMQSTRSIALDLPQKMLVWENEEGSVFISYNNPEYLKTRHNLDGNEDEITQISNALEMLANSAAGVEN